MEALLPSEVARLVYGYLIEENCPEAAKTFLETSKHLKECLHVHKRGRKFQTKIGGKNLSEFLDLLFEALNEAKSLAKELPLDSEAMMKILSLLRIFSIEVPLKSGGHGLCRECKVEEELSEKKLNGEYISFIESVPQVSIDDSLQKVGKITSIKSITSEPKISNTVTFNKDDSIELESSDSNTSFIEIDKTTEQPSSGSNRQEHVDKELSLIKEVIHEEPSSNSESSSNGKDTGDELMKEIKMEVVSEGEDVIEVEVIEGPSKRPSHHIACKPFDLLKEGPNKISTPPPKSIYKHNLPQVSPKPLLSYEVVTKKMKAIPSGAIKTYAKKAKLDLNNLSSVSVPVNLPKNTMPLKGKQVITSLSTLMSVKRTN